MTLNCEYPLSCEILAPSVPLRNPLLLGATSLDSHDTHESLTSTRTVPGGFSILSHALVWIDNIDCINKAILIVRNRLNMSGIDLSSSSAVQVLLTFLCVRSQRCHNEEHLDETMQLFPTVANDRYCDRGSLRPTFRAWPCTAPTLRDSKAVQRPSSFGAHTPPENHDYGFSIKTTP